MNMRDEGSRDIGFLGPEFLGLGLFSELPEDRRVLFKAWLVAEGREFHGDQYAARDYASFAMYQAFKRLKRTGCSRRKAGLGAGF